MPKFICSKCGKSVGFETAIFACPCGGLYDLEFNPVKFDLNLIDQREFSLFRYPSFSLSKTNFGAISALAKG